MKYTLIFLIFALFAVASWALSQQMGKRDSKAVYVEGIGSVEIRKSKWKTQDKTTASRRFLQQIYGWYIKGELVELDRGNDPNKTITDSIKNSPVIIVSHSKIPHKKFWIPVVSRPALIGVESLNKNDIDIFYLQGVREISLDFVDGVWLH
jgi:hypothetical protein